MAVADDGTALWSNPAGLARDPGLDIQLFAGGLASNRNEFTSALRSILDVDLDAVRRGQDLPALIRGIEGLVRLTLPGTGAVGSGAAGLMFGLRGFAVGIGDVPYAVVHPTVDPARVLPGTDPATSFAFNQSSLTFLGLEARELRVGYATGFFSNTLLVGASVRYVRGRTEENARESDEFAFDAGAMVSFLGIVRVGISSTAINEPEFEVARVPGAPESVRLPGTLRAGISVQPVGLLLLAADYDLEETDTLPPQGGSVPSRPGFAKSRQFSAGVELKVPSSPYEPARRATKRSPSRTGSIPPGSGSA